MAISGQKIINIGLQNEAAGSDSLYAAFHKVQDNFNNLFSCSSPYSTVTGNTGISVTSNAIAGTVDVLNTGVTSIAAGSGIVIDRSTGNVIISSTGGNGGGGGTVTSVSVATGSTARMTVTGSPIVSSGTIVLDLATSGVYPGTYTYPTLNVDAYGRITEIANGNSVGTVTSVGIIPGYGIQVSNSPITTSGTISITNTGVTRLSAGTGIQLSGSNGNVTIAATLSGGTVTYVGVSSNTLSVTNSPIVNEGTINVELPSNMSISGNIIASALIANNQLTLMNASSEGKIEYNGVSFCGTPAPLQKGIIPTEQLYSPYDDYFWDLGTSSSQSAFGVGVGLRADTRYFFKMKLYVSRSTTDGRALTLSWEGITPDKIAYSVVSSVGAPGVLLAPFVVDDIITAAFNVPATVTMTGLSTDYYTISVSGTIYVGATGGTLTPMIGWSGANFDPGIVTVHAPSTFSVYPIGSGYSDISVGDWT